MFSFVLFEFSHAGSPSDLDKKEDQIKQIETDLSREREKYLKFGIKEKSLLGQLYRLDKEIADKRKLLKSLKKRIYVSEAEMKRQREKIRQLEHSAEIIEKRMGKRLVAFYKYAKRGYVHLLATSRDLDQLRKRMQYLQIIMNEDHRLLQQTANVQLKYEREISRINEKLDTIEGMKKAESNQLTSLKKDIDKKIILLMKVHKEKEFYQKAVRELQLAAQKLKQTIVKLDKEQKKKKILPFGFAKFKGKLPLPFDGKILKDIIPVGKKSLDAHKGIYVKGPPGTEVKAIYPGRVDFSGLLKGYGQTVVLNHGSRFFTISAHLAKTKLKEGELVKKGEVIGWIGQTGPVKDPAIYFEIRKGGKNLDALKWLKVD